MNAEFEAPLPDDYPEHLIREILLQIGEDPSREGLQATPARVVAAWREWFSGYTIDPSSLFTVFEDGAEGVSEMVLLTDIPVMSHCEHHMAPFVGVAQVAYIPDGCIIGISKLARIVDVFARRLQVQERLTQQIADCIDEHLKPIGVGVIITARHFCMATRGVKCPNVFTTTSCLRGVFREPQVRAEFLSLVDSNRIKGVV